MDLQKVIEEEIKKQVEEKLESYKKEVAESIKQEYDNKLKKLREELYFKITAAINHAFNDNIDKDDTIDTMYNKYQKCDYPNCKNYGNGKLDDICITCDSYKIKQEKIKKSSLQKKIDDIINKEQKLKQDPTIKKEIKDTLMQILNVFGITEKDLEKAITIKF